MALSRVLDVSKERVFCIKLNWDGFKGFISKRIVRYGHIIVESTKKWSHSTPSSPLSSSNHRWSKVDNCQRIEQMQFPKQVFNIPHTQMSYGRDPRLPKRWSWTLGTVDSIFPLHGFPDWPLSLSFRTFARARVKKLQVPPTLPHIHNSPGVLGNVMVCGAEVGGHT